MTEPNAKIPRSGKAGKPDTNVASVAAAAFEPIAPENDVTAKARKRPAKAAPVKIALTDAQVWTLPRNRKLHIADDGLFEIMAHNGLVVAHGILHDSDGTVMRRADGMPLEITALINKPGAHPAIMWTGRIDVLSSYIHYDVTAGRNIDYASGARHTIVRTTDRRGNVRELPVSVSMTRKSQSIEYLDALGIVAVDSPAMIGRYIRAQTDGLPDDAVTLATVGPVMRSDGSHMIATLTGAYDESGKIVPGYRGDMSTLKQEYLRGMHDLMPADQITDGMLTAGLNGFADLLRISPDYPEVSAAHVGQLAVSILAPISGYMDYWSTIWFHAKAGTGKTEYEQLISAIQSPRLRTGRSDIRPEINLGDVSGTSKGPKYRITPFGLGTICSDDVFKASDSPLLQMQRTVTIDNMIRSKEAGAAAIGTVDRVLNQVGASASGELSTSMRVTAEGMPPSGKAAENSTLDRIILVGGFTDPWHKVFDRKISARLRLPESQDAMYAAYSHISYWVFTHQDVMPAIYARADAETESWSMHSARLRRRYTGVVAGLLVLERIASDLGHAAAADGQAYGVVIAGAVAGLRNGAERQNARNRPLDLAGEFLSTLRLALADSRVAAVGRPVRATGAHDQAAITPYIIHLDGDEPPRLEWPSGVSRPEDIGLKMDGIRAMPKRGDAVELFVRPPKRTANGGRGTALERSWHLVAPKNDKTFERLCSALSYMRGKAGDNLVFEPESVAKALTEVIPYACTQIRYFAVPSEGIGKEDQTASKRACVLIPFELVMTDTEN
jgi:hypothetical protein